MKGTAMAAAILASSLVPVAGSEPNTSMERLLAAISKNSAILTASSGLDAQLWREREAKLRAVRAKISPAIGLWDRNGTRFIPEWTGEFQGLTWAGNGSINGAVDGGGSAEIGLLLVNADRKRVAYTERLGALSEAKRKLVREAILLDGLKSALALRIDLAALDEEDSARKSFDRSIDTLLLKLRPFVDGGLIPANGLNNILGLKESNLEQALFQSAEAELLKKRSRESLLLDSADFVQLDLDGVFTALDARNGRLPQGRHSYANRLDSLEYEIARAQLEMERIQDNQMFIGVGMGGWQKPDAPMEKGYRLRLGWNASFGRIPEPGKKPAPTLPLHTVEPEQPGMEGGVEETSRRARKQLTEALAGRLSEIRLGQVASVFAISENLGRLVDNSLRPIFRRRSLRLHAIMRIESLEEFGLRAPEAAEGS